MGENQVVAAGSHRVIAVVRTEADANQFLENDWRAPEDGWVLRRTVASRSFWNPPKRYSFSR